MKLNLDWKLEGTEARMDFARKYIEQNPDLTEANLEMVANYVLWACPDYAELGLEGKESPWVKKGKEVSLEGAQENGGSVVEAGADYRVKRVTLERKAVLKGLLRDEEEFWSAAKGGALSGSSDAASIAVSDEANNANSNVTPIADSLFEVNWKLQQGKRKVTGSELSEGLRAELTERWRDLWTQIDKLEYTIQFWELLNGKRVKEIREELFRRLNLIAGYEGREPGNLVGELEMNSLYWSTKDHWVGKRKLVSLRSEQYELWDMMKAPLVMRKPQSGIYWSDGEGDKLKGFYPFEDVRLQVGPIDEGLFRRGIQDKMVSALARLDAASSCGSADGVIWLNDPRVIRYFLEKEDDFEVEALRMNILNGSRAKALLSWFRYYVGLARAKMTPELLLLMDEKRKGNSNKQIAAMIKEQFGITYQENYLSTVYTKRVIQAIAKEVEAHEKLINYLTMGRTVFKQCHCCGKLLPRNRDYFNQKSAQRDGFLNICKMCKKAQKEDKKKGGK